MEKTGFEKIVAELSYRFRDHPDKHLIIGYTVGVIEKHKNQMINETLENLMNLHNNEIFNNR